MPRLTIRPLARRIVLGGAVLGALVVAFGPYAPSVQAGETYAETRIVRELKLAQADVAKAAKDTAGIAKEANEAAKAAAKEAAQMAKDEAQAAKDAADAEEAPTVTIDRHGIRVEDSSGKKKRVHIGLGGPDREYDSFDQFVHEDRGLAVMVIGIVFIVFLTPVLITGLFIWYKLRKNRMLNDTMVQLAEKGVAPTGDMLNALVSGTHSQRCKRDGRAGRRGRAGKDAAQPCRLDGLAQGGHPRGGRTVVHRLFYVRRPLSQLDRAGAAVPGHRLRLPVVFRRPPARHAAGQRSAPTTAGGRRVRPTPCRTRR
jgi:hypothetical protein